MYSQTMAARFDCKKLLRFALATLCLLALALLMPVAARAEENTEALQETKKWSAEKDNTTYATFERNGEAKEEERKQGRVTIEVYVMKPGKAAYSNESSVEGIDYDKYTTSEFYYQYNANVDDGLVFDGTNHTFTELNKNNKGGKGSGGYGSLDLKVTAGEGYTIYRVDYRVCYSSEGPTKTGWKTEKFDVNNNESGPTPYCYLDNIQDNTIAKVYLMPAYTVQYKVVDKDGNIADASTYSVATGSLNDVTGVLPYKENLENVGKCDVLQKTASYTKDDGTIAPYHRWCSAENEEDAVKLVKDRLKYDANTSVELPVLKAAEGYTVSAAWKHGNQEYSDTLDLSKLSATEFAALTKDENSPLTITLTAVVTKVPTSTDNSGNSGTTGGNTGNTGSGDGNTGSGNTGSGNTDNGNNGNNGGQESTTTPAPETTPTSTSSVTTITAVAPTATPTATPAPTAEPTATPAPAAVSARIPQTSDDMPYTLLVVTALASLCAAGALFMKRRSK